MEFIIKLMNGLVRYFVIIYGIFILKYCNMIIKKEWLKLLWRFMTLMEVCFLCCVLGLVLREKVYSNWDGVFV